MNEFRNLYRVVSGRAVVAFITAFDADSAKQIYRMHGGEQKDVVIERMTFGYPHDVRNIYQ